MNSWYLISLRIDPMNDLIKLTFDHSYGNAPSIDLSGSTTEVTPIKRTKFYNLRVVGYLDFDPDYMTNDSIYMSIDDMRYLEKEYQKYMEQNQSGYYNGNSEEQEYSQVYVKAKNMKDVSAIQKTAAVCM